MLDLDHNKSWPLKNWCFWTLVLEKPPESPLDWKGSNQSSLKETSLEYSLEGLMLKLKLQYFGHLMERADSLEKTLMLGKTEGKRKGWQRMRWLDSITNSMDLVWARQGSLVCCSQCNYKELNVTLNEQQLKNKIYNCSTPKAIRNLITMPMMSVRSHSDYSL